MSHYESIREELIAEWAKEEEKYYKGLPDQGQVEVEFHAAYEGVVTTDIIKEDVVNHPKHYTRHPSGIECIQVTEHMSFCLGSAIKYLWRCDDKGYKIQDLQKAVWYINREIERLEAQDEH